jgi:hypothetical protein
MIFHGEASGLSDTAILLPNDTLIDLTKIAQASLRVKLVRPRMPERIGIYQQRVAITVEEVAAMNAQYDFVWRGVVGDINRRGSDDDPIFNKLQQQLEWLYSQSGEQIRHRQTVRPDHRFQWLERREPGDGEISLS